MFLTGPASSRRVTRERVSARSWAARVHGANGVAHLVADDDVARRRAGPRRARPPAARAGGALPLHPPAARGPAIPADACRRRDRQVYDVRDVAARLVDGGALLELAARWARNLVVGLARIEGAAGRRDRQPAAPPRRHARRRAASQKGAWFVDLCDRFGVPLVVLVDTPGFLPGAAQERAGVIRHGAALLRAFAVATTPRVTVTLRQAYGGAHIVDELARPRSRP